jgi:hypothetical protein
MKPFYLRENRLYPWFRGMRKLYNTMGVMPLKSLNRLKAVQMALAAKDISVDKLFNETDNYKETFISQKRNNRRIF